MLEGAKSGNLQFAGANKVGTTYWLTQFSFWLKFGGENLIVYGRERGLKAFWETPFWLNHSSEIIHFKPTFLVRLRGACRKKAPFLGAKVQRQWKWVLRTLSSRKFRRDNRLWHRYYENNLSTFLDVWTSNKLHLKSSPMVNYHANTESTLPVLRVGGDHLWTVSGGRVGSERVKVGTWKEKEWSVWWGFIWLLRDYRKML